jgi:large subunit ribosomal protein L24e
MAKCSFSGDEIKKGTGKMYVKDNGQVLWFKNSKCEKNYLKLKRDPRKFKWTAFYEKGTAPATSSEKKTVKKK